MVISVFVVGEMGLNKKFVTTRLSGENEIVNRISFRVVKRTVIISIIVFAILLGGDSLLFVLADKRFSVVSNVAFWVFCRMPIVAFITFLYKCLLCFVYNMGRKDNDDEIKGELIWRRLVRK
jgi:Ca2+/Na+ antiporter